MIEACIGILRTTRMARLAVGVPAALVLAASLAGVACSGEANEAGGSDLVVERVTDGNVTTVRNVSGSIWGAPATLVEDLSIGVFEGEEAYMFGAVSGLWVTEDRLYVVDTQAPAVRLYDLAGSHLGDLGGEGQGPGEYQSPSSIVVLGDGTVVVRDLAERRIVFFEPGGGTRTWRPERGFLRGLDLLGDGTLLIRLGIPPEEEEGGGPRVFMSQGGVAPLSNEGDLGELRYPPDFGFVDEPIVVQVGGSIMAMSGGFLFRPYLDWTVAPDGSLVAGLSDAFHFEMHAPGGAVTKVERYWEPIAVDPGEADYAIAQIEGQFRSMDPDWTYEGEPPATTKPAFDSLSVDRDGRTWVRRSGAARRVDDCEENPREDPAAARQRPCWVSPAIVDAFAPDGSYLGELIRPEGLTFRAVFIKGGEYWAAVEDADGLVTVRRFRLVTPQDT